MSCVSCRVALVVRVAPCSFQHGGRRSSSSSARMYKFRHLVVKIISRHAWRVVLNVTLYAFHEWNEEKRRFTTIQFVITHIKWRSKWRTLSLEMILTKCHRNSSDVHTTGLSTLVGLPVPGRERWSWTFRPWNLCPERISEAPSSDQLRATEWR